MEVDSVLPADPEASSRRRVDHTWRLTTTLFIGNSYTTVNDLPSVFASLARSGGHRVETGNAAVDGWTLADHAGSSATAMMLASKNWDIVVLQEQSQIPSVESFRQNQMYPAARRLIGSIRNQGARPLFYLTWGRRDGWPENAMPDYARMQTAIDEGYLAIGGDQRVAIAPVGDAWVTLVARGAGATLWQLDGSHPTEAGTYLAACVFYATIFRESPEGLSYQASLPADAATTIQAVAAETVLEDPAKWPAPSE
jgi:hypothetical protein